MGTTIAERAENMPIWLAAVTDQEDPIVIPEDWLSEPEIIEPEQPVKEAKRRRGKKAKGLEEEMDERFKTITGDLPSLEELGDDFPDFAGGSASDEDLEMLFEDDDK